MQSYRIQCRCHNTSTIICSRSRSFPYQPKPIIHESEILPLDTLSHKSETKFEIPFDNSRYYPVTAKPSIGLATQQDYSEINARELPDQSALFPLLPNQILPMVVPQSRLMDITTKPNLDPPCCLLGNCPIDVKCNYPAIVPRNESGKIPDDAIAAIHSCLYFVRFNCHHSYRFTPERTSRKENSYSVPFYFLSILFYCQQQLQFQFSDCATRCYTGRNHKYISKLCDSGGSNSREFVCHKFICDGGKSPFTLRTCAKQQLGCVAGSSICRLSGGEGSCSRCDKNNCNV
ncbi:unnamed protein product [Thelazia callipaeda]|uniref:Uncharacterized protein n=1 Tax=Thelazia callipaeda TaxID=103827 RepID=A0A0N5CL98_THECL|nr:unnamed protein product [Thelazia callipaeda]